MTNVSLTSAARTRTRTFSTARLRPRFSARASRSSTNRLSNVWRSTRSMTFMGHLRRHRPRFPQVAGNGGDYAPLLRRVSQNLGIRDDVIGVPVVAASIHVVAYFVQHRRRREPFPIFRRQAVNGSQRGEQGQWRPRAHPSHACGRRDSDPPPCRIDSQRSDSICLPERVLRS